VVPKGQLVVCDMSSNFASRPVDWSKFDVVYAGAQKNLGPAGICVNVIRKSLITKARKDTPILLDWPLFDKAQNKCHNTPNCWTIYMIGLNVQHMLEQGGLEHQKEKAAKRSEMLYNYIDNSNGYYSNATEAKYRSRMNIPFRVKCDEELEKKFAATAQLAGLKELAGHKSVGGCRASLYNAMTIEGVEALIVFMKTFAAEHP
jgi:phosphoserine aminotransferase